MSASALLLTSLWLFFCIVPSSREQSPPGTNLTKSLYSTVVVFGDSYSDPYQSMPEKKNVWPTFFMDMLPQVKNKNLYDYAYVGAHANNTLTHYGTVHIPDTNEQMEEFNTQLKKGEISFGDEQTLIVFWIGINPVLVIWLETFGPQQNGGNSPSFQTALDRVDKQVSEIETQLNHLRSVILPMRNNSTDFLMIDVPHMDLTPSIKDLATKWSGGDSKKMTDYLEHLVTLIERFNTGLRGVTERQKKSEKGEKTAGTVKMCDVVPTWDKILKEGSQDSIHPMPKVQKILADWIFKSIYG